MIESKSKWANRIATRIAVAFGIVVVSFGQWLARPQVALAYEVQDGPAWSCQPGWAVTIGAYVYGDWNLYSNYGLENHQYNIPYNQLSYAVAWTAHNSIADSDAEAENYVDGAVGTDCIVK